MQSRKFLLSHNNLKTLKVCCPPFSLSLSLSRSLTFSFSLSVHLHIWLEDYFFPVFLYFYVVFFSVQFLYSIHGTQSTFERLFEGVVRRGPCTYKAKRYVGTFTSSLYIVSKFDEFMNVAWELHSRFQCHSHISGEDIQELELHQRVDWSTRITTKHTFQVKIV